MSTESIITITDLWLKIDRLHIEYLKSKDSYDRRRLEGLFIFQT